MSNLLTFKAISNFVIDLSSVYENKYRALELYNHLISKTTIAHDKPIQKHVDAFRKFCVKNRNAILDKKYDEIEDGEDGMIVYSERVRIPIKDIFNDESGKSNHSVIWQHLLTIAAMVDPTSNAKSILQKQKEASPNETNFISKMFEKVEKNINPDELNTQNPMENISTIMNSGIFQDMVNDLSSGIDNGSLDIGKLLGSVQNMVSNNDGDDLGENNPLSGIMSMTSNMINGLQNQVELQDEDGGSSENALSEIPQPTSMPDPQDMMNMMSMLFPQKKKED